MAGWKEIAEDFELWKTLLSDRGGLTQESFDWVGGDEGELRLQYASGNVPHVFQARFMGWFDAGDPAFLLDRYASGAGGAMDVRFLDRPLPTAVGEYAQTDSGRTLLTLRLGIRPEYSVLDEVLS